jgi:L-fucose isomerase-like protein
MMQVLHKAGIGVVVLGLEDSKHGAVATFEEAKRCAELFRSKSSQIDGVVVTLPNFGDERAIADTLRRANLGVPVLIQATPDTPGQMLITHRRDSFCGKMSACNNLRQYGIPYSITTLHIRKPRFRGVCERPELVRRGVPNRQGFKEPADWRNWGTASGIQYREIQREAAGGERNHSGNVRSFGSAGADQPNER